MYHLKYLPIFFALGIRSKYQTARSSLGLLDRGCLTNRSQKILDALVGAPLLDLKIVGTRHPCTHAKEDPEWGK